MYAKQLQYDDLSQMLLEEATKEYDNRLKRYRLSGLPTERDLHSEERLELREAMMKGYIEMAEINLQIAQEFSYVEYEAEHVVERLLIGG